MKPTIAALIAVPVIIAATVAIYLLSNFQNGHVQGDSMAPTLNDGDRMVSQRWGKDVELGSIVILKTSHSEHEIVKRVVGLPGYTILPPMAQEAIVLGRHQYWVLGDNLPVSKDSRHFGPITKDDITGIVVYIRNQN